LLDTYYKKSMIHSTNILELIDSSLSGFLLRDVYSMVIPWDNLRHCIHNPYQSHRDLRVQPWGTMKNATLALFITISLSLALFYNPNNSIAQLWVKKEIAPIADACKSNCSCSRYCNP
jgi:hypothetical protein